MIIPSHMLEDLGPPTDYCLKMRKWIIGLVFVMIATVFGRCLVGDVVGGLCQMCVAFIGYAIAFGEPVCQVKWIWMFTFFCFLNAGFDLGLAMVRTVHVYKHYKEPNSKKDLESKFSDEQIAFVLIVSHMSWITEMIGAGIGYSMFKNAHEEAIYNLPLAGQGGYGDYGSNNIAGDAATRAGVPQSQNNGIQNGQGRPTPQQTGQAVRNIASGQVNTRLPEPVNPQFQAFAGTAHKLDNSPEKKKSGKKK